MRWIDRLLFRVALFRAMSSGHIGAKEASMYLSTLSRRKP